MTLSRSRRIQAACIGVVGPLLMRVLGASWRWVVQGAEHVDRTRAEGRQPIYALWHGRILAGTIYLRNRDIVVMTSENFDGEWIARIIKRFGFLPARGSSSRGGARALAEMRRAMGDGRPAAFTVDGPRGPARVAQPGAAWLASRTGNPIVPFHIEASSAWTVSSWDRHQIPKPGATVAVVIGPPMEVAANADDAAIEQARRDLEEALTRLEAQAAGMLGRGVASSGEPAPRTEAGRR